MKETFYFQHDYNAKDDPKILELRAKYGAGGYGAYWMLLESMASEENGHLNRGAIGGLSVAYAIPIGELSEIIEFCVQIGLFIQSDEVFFSERMIEHKNIRKAAQANGLKGAQKRWKNSTPNRGAISTPNAKERKGKERKEFKAPTIENCVEYAKTIGFSGPVAFFEHYENTDWQKKTKNGELVPLKNWKLTMRTWLEKDIKPEKEANQLNNTEWAAIDISSLESIPNEQWKHLQSIFLNDKVMALYLFLFT